MKRTAWIFLVITILTLGWAKQVSAQAPTPSDDDVNAIARQLFCPVCENTPLDVCPTQACAQWRALIREKLSQGWTADQIKQYFADQYGARVLAEPPQQGLNWLPGLSVFPTSKKTSSGQKPSVQSAVNC